MWKYLIICSVGVACIHGTLWPPLPRSMLRDFRHQPLYDAASDHAALLDPVLMNGFIFLLVGYGTKRDRPMHNAARRPQSSACPVSAMFSVYVNASLYASCLCTYRRSGHRNKGWGLTLLTALGIFSIMSPRRHRVSARSQASACYHSVAPGDHRPWNSLGGIGLSRPCSYAQPFVVQDLRSARRTAGTDNEHTH